MKVIIKSSINLKQLTVLKRVYFFEFCNLTPHLETSLEIAKEHLDKGDLVYYYFLGHHTLYREAIFPSKISGNFLGPLLPERRGAKLLKHKNFNFITNVNLPKSDYSIPDIQTIEELKIVKYAGWDLGMAIASSLISLTKDSSPDIDIHRNLVQRMAKSVVSVYHFVIDILQKNRTELVYIFNGRFCNQRAVLRACEFMKVPYLIHERGANKSLYYVRPFMPHDKNKIQDEMRRVWYSLTDKKAGELIAKEWFRARRSGIETDWYSYSKFQKRDLLPDLNKTKRIVTYFHSSDDEYAAIGDQFLWIGWKDQYDAVIRLIQLIAKKENIQLIIRLHPHLAKKSKEENIKWASLSKLSDRIILILPSSEVDSYALIDHSDIIISSGSKAGIESVFYNKPSILLGPSPYDSLDVTYKAHSLKELEILLDQNHLSIKNYENLLMYGYWWATHGDPYKFYKPHSLSSGTFLGKNLQYRPQLLRTVILLYKKVRSIF